MTEPSPQISPDGQWRWDGTQWVPNQPTPPGYPAQPAYPAPPLYGTPYAPQPSTNDGKAIGSLVASILGLFCFVGSIVGVVLGHTSRAEARRQGRAPSGLSTAGLIIGYIGIALLVAVAMLFATGTWVKGSFSHTQTTFCSQPTSSECP